MSECGTWGILGGGFGLYGYLPAVAVRTRGKIHTLERYRGIVLGRPDIRHLVDRVTFEPDTGAVLTRCTKLVIALRPADQESLLIEILDRKWKGKLILEKPLARTPGKALALLERLAGSGIIYRIGFTLGTTTWFTRVTEYLAAHRNQTVLLQFQWHFLAHHYRCDVDTWKRFPAQGGGTTRFYAIHLIALLAGWGIDTPLSFNRELTAFDDEPRCNFTATDGNQSAVVSCDSCWPGEPSFAIRVSAAGSTPLEIMLADPFAEGGLDRMIVPQGESDNRVGNLTKIIDTLDEAGEFHSSYIRHARLWQEVENSA